MFFATRDIKVVEEFWLTYFMMTTIMKDYIVENTEAELRKNFRNTIEGQFEHDLYNKFFSNQLESDDEIDTLQHRIKSWILVVDMGGTIPNDVFDYTFDELYVLYCKAIDPEMQNLVKTLRGRDFIS